MIAPALPAGPRPHNAVVVEFRLAVDPAATLPHPALDLDQAGDAFAVEVCIDHEAAPSDGLTEAVARLLIDLYRRRLARERADDESQRTEVA